MEELIKDLETIVDVRQQSKVLHKMKDIILLVLFGLLANADEWVEIEVFGEEHEEFLREYLELPNGIPSHDTIQRVMAVVPVERLQKFKALWYEYLNSEKGDKIQKFLAIDGKTQRGNRNKNQKANHIVNAVDENGFCVSEVAVDSKSNEITAIPKLLDTMDIKNTIVTIDAMGTQREIAAKIKSKRADYVLALKKNQEMLFEDVSLYFADKEFLSKCKYTKTTEKAHGQIEKREYWQTSDIDWLTQRGEWKGLKSIVMTRNTITKDEKTIIEERYFISSLEENINLLSIAIRKHWMVESTHWHLDVTFREDGNKTLEKQAAFNLNILRKIALSILKIFEVSHKPRSLKKKRFAICTNPEKLLKKLISL